jgi:hypothetical protein
MACGLPLRPIGAEIAGPADKSLLAHINLDQTRVDRVDQCQVDGTPCVTRRSTDRPRPEAETPWHRRQGQRYRAQPRQAEIHSPIQGDGSLPLGSGRPLVSDQSSPPWLGETITLRWPDPSCAAFCGGRQHRGHEWETRCLPHDERL